MKLTFTALIFATLTTFASADFFLTQESTPAPVYPEHSVNFDEPGVPVNVATDPFDFYQASQGITFTSGTGFLVASNWDDMEFIAGGTNPGNQLNGGFSVRMVFDEPITELSWQGWANGNGPPFGGMNVFVFNDESRAAGGPDNAIFQSPFGQPVPFGGIGPDYFNLTSTNGDSFDEVRFFNGAFNSFNTYVDNISFGAFVPEPSSMGLLMCAGCMLLLIGRRR